MATPHSSVLLRRRLDAMLGPYEHAFRILDLLTMAQQRAGEPGRPRAEVPQLRRALENEISRLASGYPHDEAS